MSVEPYLFFEGHCEEALGFYVEIVAAKINMLMRFSDSPDDSAQPMVPAGMESKIMHASFSIGTINLLASDGQCRGTTNFQGFAISLTVPSILEAERVFTALSAAGEVRVALCKTFFSPAFGVLVDRFGLPWTVVAAASAQV